MPERIIKWIVCDVPHARREDFGREQRRWSVLADADGFVAQVGGWDQFGHACIVGVWRDECAYKAFMEKLHDEIFESGQQGASYKSSQVVVAKQVLDMPGECSTLAAASGAGGFLRVADCRVKPDRLDHFLNAQQDIWRPGMADVGGMFGGVFSRGIDDELRYFVMTFWSDSDSHAAYTESTLPRLRKQATPDDDLSSLEGIQVNLVDDWRVIGKSI